MKSDKPKANPGTPKLKLKLRKETMKTLAPNDLAGMVGGLTFTNTWTLACALR
jgi:hypothetical protein